VIAVLSDVLFWITLGISAGVSYSVTLWWLRRERRPKREKPRIHLPPFKESDHG